MRILTLAIILTGLAFANPCSAQMAATKDAQYLAIVKAVSNYKIDDEEQVKNVEKLRENKRFNDKLTKMMEKLSNGRSKNSKNQQVYDILLNAGKQIDKILNP